MSTFSEPLQVNLSSKYLNHQPVNIQRIHIHDQKSSNRFLIDTGADISIIPPALKDLRNAAKLHQLFAANGSPIQTYGTKRLTVDLGLRRPFVWVFTIADVKSPIIGADFLKHYDLLVDLRRSKLIDNTTKFEVCNINAVSEPSIKTFDTNSPFDEILKEYQDLTILDMNHKATKANVMHQIITTGQSVFCRPRRLPIDKINVAKAEFKFLLDQGICQPSKSC